MKKVLFLLVALVSMQRAMDIKEAEKPEKLVNANYISADLADAKRDYKAHGLYKPTYSVNAAEFLPSFLRLFAYIPRDLHQAIADYIPCAYHSEKDLPAQLNKLQDSSFLLRVFKWKALGYYFGLMPFYSYEQGYFYFEQPRPNTKNSLLKGIRQDTSVKALVDLDDLIAKLTRSRDIRKDEYISMAKNEWQETAESLVKEYKIHLMPNGDPTPVIIALLKLLNADPELQELIAAFKVLTSDQISSSGVYFPRVVIYPAAGKANAQKALNKLYMGLKDIPGLGIKPRYNAKVTDLIWIAQGDSYYKNIPAYQSFFEQPKRVYFRADLTGKVENYHLIHPETGKEISTSKPS
ncbi:hypothetical protein BH09DEP1_BH09DEP1_5430 [soil metagenome]